MYSYNVVFDSKSGYDNIDYTQIYNKKPICRIMK